MMMNRCLCPMNLSWSSRLTLSRMPMPTADYHHRRLEVQAAVIRETQSPRGSGRAKPIDIVHLFIRVSIPRCGYRQTSRAHVYFWCHLSW